MEALLIIVGIGIALWVWGRYADEKDAERAHQVERQRIKLEEEAATKVEATIAAEREKLNQFGKNTLLLQMKTASLRKAFDTDFLTGRNWLAAQLAAWDASQSDAAIGALSQRAVKATEAVAIAKAERNKALIRNRFLEAHLASWKEYFPILEEYEDEILNEAATLDLAGIDETVDPVSRYLSKEDFERLSTAERNQLAFQKYMTRPKSNWEIGRMYERWIGHQFERDGWSVHYHGALAGLEDMGRDLICKKGHVTEIVQAKCWSTSKTIREKHVFQLYGTLVLARLDDPSGIISGKLVTSAALSDVAMNAAKHLGITVVQKHELSKSYPMIKCNINARTNERIYHLPFDQQYDRVKILPSLGEKYVTSAHEAEREGFRRAFRFTGAANNIASKG